MKLKLKRFLITSAILVSSIARHHLITATDALPLSSGSLADSSPTRAVHVHSHKNTNTNKPLNTNTNTNTDISTMNKITATATGRNAIRNTRHYIFGYGSLICPQSRKITCPTLTKPAIPVIVQHIQRTWTARLEHKAVTAAAAGEEEKSDLDPLRGQTAMGIQLAEGHECTGVLIEVDDQELANFDQRERGYDRVQIDLNHIFPHEDGSIDINVNVDGSIDHHNRHRDRHHHHHVIRQSHRTRKNLMARNSNMDDADDSSERQHHNEQEEEDEEDEAKVWVYLPKGGGSGANHQYPILQSYVDIILRGCLTISKEFAKSFLESTHGWDHDPDLHGEFLWLDDRHLPYYSRADTGWSEEMKHFIDELVRDVHPEPLEKRMHLDTLRERLRCTE